MASAGKSYTCLKVHSSKGMHNKLAGKGYKIDDLLHVRLYKCMIAADDQDLLGKLYWGMPNGTYTVQCSSMRKSNIDAKLHKLDVKNDQGLCNQNLKEKSMVMKVNRTKVILYTAMVMETGT